MKINGRSIMFPVTETASHAFDFFNFAVEPFYKSIRNSMMNISDYVIEVASYRLCSSNYRVEPGMGGPEVPLLEKLTSPCFTRIIPEMTQVFLDCPCPRYVEIGILQPAEFRYSPRGDILGIPEPKVFGSLQKLIALLFEVFMFFLSDGIHSLRHMTRYMKAVKHDLAFPLRNVLPGGRNKRVPHIHRYRCHRSLFFLRKLLIVLFKALLSVIIGNEFNRASCMIAYQRFVFAPFRKRLLIDGNACGNSLRFATQSSIHCASYTSIRHIPAQPRQPSSSGHRALQGEFYDVTLHLESQVSIGLPELRENLPHAMSRALHTGKPGVDKGPHLTGTQMLKLTLWCMIIGSKELPAFRTGDPNRIMMRDVHIDAFCLLIHLHTVHVPGILETGKLEIELFCIHAIIILHATQPVGGTHEKP